MPSKPVNRNSLPVLKTKPDYDESDGGVGSANNVALPPSVDDKAGVFIPGKQKPNIAARLSRPVPDEAVQINLSSEDFQRPTNGFLDEYPKIAAVLRFPLTVVRKIRELAGRAFTAVKSKLYSGADVKETSQSILDEMPPNITTGKTGKNEVGNPVTERDMADWGNALSNGEARAAKRSMAAGAQAPPQGDSDELQVRLEQEIASLKAENIKTHEHWLAFDDSREDLNAFQSREKKDLEIKYNGADTKLRSLRADLEARKKALKAPQD